MASITLNVIVSNELINPEGNQSNFWRLIQLQAQRSIGHLAAIDWGGNIHSPIRWMKGPDRTPTEIRTIDDIDEFKEKRGWSTNDYVEQDDENTES